MGPSQRFRRGRGQRSLSLSHLGRQRQHDPRKNRHYPLTSPPPQTYNLLKGSTKEVRMSLTASTMLALGSKAPDFKLPDVVSGRSCSLQDFTSKKALLVMFM